MDCVGKYKASCSRINLAGAAKALKEKPYCFHIVDSQKMSHEKGGVKLIITLTMALIYARKPIHDQVHI